MNVTSDAPIQVVGLTKQYGDFVALDACHLQVPKGEILGLLGPNGAGKTTLLRLILGLIKPTAGHASVDGLSCYEQRDEVHRRVAYLPGDSRLFRRMRADELLKFFATLRGHNDLARARDVAERLELDLTRRVGSMSTGMRQKLGIASTLSARVPFLILDEPTANLDPTVRAEVLRIVLEARDDGATVIFSSHVLSEIEELCDRVVLLRQGKLVHEENLAQLKRQHRLVASWHGPSPVPPDSLKEFVSVLAEEHRLVVETDGQLGRVLHWLGDLQLDDVRIEPVGLRNVYERWHGPTRRTDQPADQPLLSPAVGSELAANED